MLGHLSCRLGWRRDCQLVAFEGNTYADLPPEMLSGLEARYPWGSAQRSVWNQYGIWAFVGLAGLGFFIRGDDEES